MESREAFILGGRIVYHKVRQVNSEYRKDSGGYKLSLKCTL